MKSSITFIITIIILLSFVPLYSQDTAKTNLTTKIDSTFIDSSTVESADVTNVKVDTLLIAANQPVPATERKGFHIVWIMIAILLILCFIGFRYKHKG
jgi:hypothetical protein